jgi:signal transduction histidine kinase
MLLTMNKTSEEIFLQLDNLTKWSKLTQNKMQPHRQKTDIHSLLGSIVGVYNPIAQLKRVTLSLQMAESELQAMVDVDLLKTILRNLLASAIRHSHPESLVHISARRNRESVHFRINFRRESEISASDLALQLCKASIELHDGRLEILSDTPPNSSFLFSLRVGNS